MSTYIDQRLSSLDATNKERIEADKRSLERYEHDRADRARRGGIFSQSNVPLPLTAMVVDHFRSRAYDELLGERPFFTVRPQGANDRNKAQAIQRFSRYKLVDEADIETAFDHIITAAHTQRAGISKGIYHEDKDTFERMGLKALHDVSVQPPKPVEILGVGKILEDAEWIEQPDPLAEPPPPSADPMAPPPAPATRIHLKADPSFILDASKHQFIPLGEPVEFTRTLYAGPKSVLVESADFRAPDDCADLKDADFVAEYYDQTADWVIDRFLERAWCKKEDYLVALKAFGADKKTGAGAEDNENPPRPDQIEGLNFDHRTHRVPIAECWFKWDVKDTGRPQYVVVFWDKRNKKPIFYDYQANLSPTGRHTYKAVTIARSRKRWWAYSIPELVEAFQEYIDEQFNRHSYRNRINANPIIAENPDAIVEKKRLSEIGPFETVLLENGKTIADYLQAFVFPNADMDTQELLDRCIDFVKLWLGISNLTQGDYSEVPQNTTAFGQDKTLNESAKLSRHHIRQVGRGLRLHLTDLVQILVATMDDEEVFYFNDGDVSLMGQMSADQVRSLTLDVSLVVGRAQNSQAIQATTLATQLVEKYATMLVQAPWMAKIVRPLYKISLRLLGFDEVDELLPDPENPDAAILAAQAALLVAGQTPDADKDKQSPEPVAEPASGGPDEPLLPFPGNAANTAASVVNGPPTQPDRNAPG